ncbi:MAG: phosphatase PAP2 family protein [Candidatus Thiodiazotropha sp.]
MPEERHPEENPCPVNWCLQKAGYSQTCQPMTSSTKDRVSPWPRFIPWRRLMFLSQPRPINRASLWLLPALSLLSLAILQLNGGNLPLFLIINGQLGHWLTPGLWESLTILGDGLVALTLLLPLYRYRPKLVLSALLAGLIAAFWVHLFKGTLALPRPVLVLGQEQITQLGPVLKRGSFPSGHTATLFALLGSLFPWLDRKARLRLFPLIFSIAGLAALSRIAVGAHWPVDILFGAAIGWLSAMASGRLLRGYTPSPAVSVWLGRFLTLCALYLLLVQDTGYTLGQPLQHGLALLALTLASMQHLGVPSPQAEKDPMSTPG